MAATAEVLTALRLDDAGRRSDLDELARHAAGGELEAFEELVRRLQRRVFGLAYQHLRDACEAEDLTQEIFLRLYRNLYKFDPERRFEPWFWKLAANACLNYARRRVPVPQELPVLSASPPEETGLAAALAELDPGYRLPILLHYYADLPVEEVAGAMGLTVAAVKSRMHRARALLRRALAEEAV
jgi:RNA polymerase sigma-70 factor (ECF subfamily)